MNRAERRTARIPDRSKRSTSVAGRDLFFAALRHHQAGRLAEAIAGYDAYLKICPNSAETCYNRGTALQQQGRLDEAVLSFRRALAIHPDDADIHNNLGNTLVEQGRRDEAIASYRRAIVLRPAHAMAHCNLGKALRLAGRLEDAATALRQAIAHDPALVEAHFTLGATLKQLGQDNGAVECFLAALTLRPEYPEALYNLGLTLQELDRLDQAVACYQAAIRLQPRFLEAYTNLGVALRLQDKLQESVTCQHIAIEIDANTAMPHNNLGVALTDLGELDEAVACFERSLAIEQRADTWNNLGVVRLGQRRLDEAIEYYRRGLTLDPNNADAHFTLATGLLARGEMEEGWREFEWRWKMRQLQDGWHNFLQPQWYGEPAEGRTLLIHSEQGFGDTLQFCRYAPLAAARGLRIVLEVQRPLVRLMRSLPGVAQVVGEGDPLPPFDLFCPMLSLPLALGTTMATIPCSGSYLQPDPGQVAVWRERLEQIAPRGLRVGLVWAGNPRPHMRAAAAVDRRRSMAPDRLTPLAAVPGVHFFTLQKDTRAIPAGMQLIDVMDQMKDFADTAALVANLDLVIAVDTAMTHLTSAIGKPVWMLDRFDACWRWFTGRRDSPWYPKLRIYRQPRAGDWESAVAEALGDLRELAAAHSICIGATFAPILTS